MLLRSVWNDRQFNRPELGWCWDCVDRLVWGYHVSCLVTIVTKNQSLGIDYLPKNVAYAPVYWA